MEIERMIPAVHRRIGMYLPSPFPGSKVDATSIPLGFIMLAYSNGCLSQPKKLIITQYDDHVCLTSMGSILTNLPINVFNIDLHADFVHSIMAKIINLPYSHETCDFIHLAPLIWLSRFCLIDFSVSREERFRQSYVEAFASSQLNRVESHIQIVRLELIPNLEIFPSKRLATLPRIKEGINLLVKQNQLPSNLKVLSIEEKYGFKLEILRD